jgi:hypothetical protein
VNEETSLSIVAWVSRVVTRAVDRITGDRSDYPLLVSAAGSYALKKLGIESHVLFGPAAWIELLEDGNVAWAGCFQESSPHFWIETQYKETVDLNASVAFKKKSQTELPSRAILSPPLLWSKEIPNFYRFHAHGAAELDLQSDRDQKWWKKIQEELDRHLAGFSENETDVEFPNEPLICGRRLLDDGEESFKKFDEALRATCLPNAPF